MFTKEMLFKRIPKLVEIEIDNSIVPMENKEARIQWLRHHLAWNELLQELNIYGFISLEELIEIGP